MRWRHGAMIACVAMGLGACSDDAAGGPTTTATTAATASDGTATDVAEDVDSETGDTTVASETGVTTEPPETTVTPETSVTPDATDATGPDTPDTTAPVTAAGDTVVVYVPSEGIGKIAVRVHLPKTPRYPEGAPIVMEVPTFFTPDAKAFYASNEAWRAGFIQVSPLLPGRADQALGVHSDGTDDYGGALSIQALADVVHYLDGTLADTDGWHLADRLPYPALSDEIGLYAFSHPGIGAINLLALHKAELGAVKWLVGRENPTSDTLSAMEVGYFDAANHPVPNPAYSYPASYAVDALALDYTKVRWNGSHPYFDLDGSGSVTSGDHVLGDKIPTMFGKQIYSARLTAALRDHGGLTAAAWPATLTTPEDAASLWAFRQSVTRYPSLAGMDMHVMLIFATRDHVQILQDKPHLHQAWDGLRAAGIWTRLNPDRAYAQAVLPSTSFPDTAANSPPANWATATSAAYDPGAGAASGIMQGAALAAIAEMADRTHDADWSPNLAAVLHTYAYDVGTTTTGPGPGGSADVHLPSAVGGAEGIAVRLHLPTSARYATGAPVAILIEGGWDPTTVKDQSLPLTDQGFIVLEYNLPGGGSGNMTSGGTYDMRGPNCWGALQDVMRFAAGSLATTDGDHLADLAAPLVPLADNLGLIGSSNGGNASILAAGAGAAAPPKLAWIVNWESPVGDGGPGIDFGMRTVGASTPNPVLNPAYNPDNGTWSWSDIAWDPDFALVSSTADITGVFFIDADHNGVANPAVAPGSDYVFHPIGLNDTYYWSIEVTQAATDHGVFPTGATGVATATQASDFWHARNGIYWIQAAVQRFPKLMFTVIASAVDHAQTAPDYPHILAQYAGFQDAGARFVRVNPDLAYVAAAGAANTTGAADNTAGTHYDHLTIRSAVEPESIPQMFTQMGAALELADRTYTNNVTPNLGAVLDLTP